MPHGISGKKNFRDKTLFCSGFGSKQKVLLLEEINLGFVNCNDDQVFFGRKAFQGNSVQRRVFLSFFFTTKFSAPKDKSEKEDLSLDETDLVAEDEVFFGRKASQGKLGFFY